MNSKLFTLSASLLFTLSACGLDHQASTLKHYPVKGALTCDTEVSIHGDPHAKVYATRVIFASDMTKADVREYATRSVNLGSGDDIFNEDFLTSSKTYDLKKANESLLDLYSRETQKVEGTIDSDGESPKKITLKLNDYSRSLSCRRVAK